MSRYLIINYFYAPIVSARAFRWHAVAREWAVQGHHVDVVCAWLPGIPEEEILDNVHVYRVNAKWLENLRAKFIKTAPVPTSDNEQKAGEVRPSKLKRWLKPPLLWLYENVYRRFYWPDDAFLWYFPARKQVKALMQTHSYDAIISVSLYFTAHLVGEVANRHAPELPWLVDMGDPFAPMEDEAINNMLYSRLNRHVERRILHKATTISVTTPGTIELYARIFDEAASKMVVIPPLLSVAHERASARDDDKIRLVYTGILYAKIRRPDFLLKVFHALLQTSLGPRLELHFYGYATQVEDAFAPYQDIMNRSIFVHGTVSRGRANQAIAEADVLVNIGNTTSYQLPSKVVEYVSTGKRILNIALIDNDSSAAFFSNYPLAITLLHSQPASAAAEQLYEFLVSSPTQMPADQLEAYVAAFMPAKIAEDYHALISRFQQSGSH